MLLKKKQLPMSKNLWWKYPVHMYINVKMRAAETIPGMEGGRIRRER
jgi:hypothetical protein